MDVVSVFARLSEGFIINCSLFGLTLLFGIPLGLIIAFGTMSRISPLKWLTKTFVWIIRGTPLMLQIIIIFYGPGLLDLTFSWGKGYTGRFIACVVAFVINYACYFSEIYRGGIESIPVGQYEAGQALGMTRVQIFFRVTILQVIKRIVPPMGNEIITLVKDTSLMRIIALKEIIFAAQDFSSSRGIIWPLFSTALFFLVAVGLLTLLLGAAERRLSYFK